MAKLLSISPFERKPVAPWIGWYRGGRGYWQRVVWAQSESECWRLLMDYRDPQRWVGSERTVCLKGERPPTRSTEGRG
jgi:hypothetical protein